MPEKKIFFLIYFMLGIKIILSTSIVNAETIIKTIPVEKNPIAEVISNDGKFVYVINNSSNSVSVIDTHLNQVIQTIKIGDGPRDIAITKDGTRIYVTNYEDATVSVIDTITNSIITTIEMKEGRHPTYLSITPDDKKVYVSNEYGTESNQGNVNVIQTDSNTVQTVIYQSNVTFSIGCPEGIAVKPDDGKYAYLNTQCLDPPGYWSHDPIFIIEVLTDSVVKLIDCLDIPNVGTCLKITPNGEQVWASGGDACTAPHPTYNHKTHEGCKGCGPPGGNPVTIIDTKTNKVKKQLFYGAPAFLSFTRDSKYAYLATALEILKIDTKSLNISKKFQIAGSSGSIVFTKDGEFAYTPITSKNEVAIFKVNE